MRANKKIFVSIFLAFVLFISSLVFAAGVDLVILHTNDIHGRIEIGDGMLGMPYIKSLVEYYRERYDHVLVMDAGDTIHGRPITDRLEGESAVISMNLVGYDFMVPGNHDFNYGYDRLLELEEIMEFHLVAANVFKDGELLFNPYVVKEVGDYTIGVFGLVTSDTYTTTHPNNIIGIEFGDMIEAAQKCVSVLRNDYRVDLVIALGHVGLNASRNISSQVPGIDLFVDGHSHSLLMNGERVGDTMIVQANEYTKYLGKVMIDMSGDKPLIEAALIPASEGKELVDPDEELVEMMQEFRDEIRKLILGF